jgi:hypothetical protein
VCLNGTIDDFPAVAIHQVQNGADGKVDLATTITLARHQEARLLGPVGLTDPFHWTETHIGNQCGQSLTGSSLVNPLAGVDWTKVITDMDCSYLGQGLQLDVLQFADITGDGMAESFVAVSCKPINDSWPDFLEVFDGASDPTHPRHMATLLDYHDSPPEVPNDGPNGPGNGSGLYIQSITILGRTVIIKSVAGYHTGITPVDVTDSFTWNGSSFTRGPRTVGK